MRIDAKIQARQWILNAIQNHSCIPNKETEREIKRFISRLQRDVKQLSKSREILQGVRQTSRRNRREVLKANRETERRFEHAISD